MHLTRAPNTEWIIIFLKRTKANSQYAFPDNSILFWFRADFVVVIIIFMFLPCCCCCFILFICGDKATTCDHRHTIYRVHSYEFTHGEYTHNHNRELIRALIIYISVFFNFFLRLFSFFFLFCLCSYSNCDQCILRWIRIWSNFDIAGRLKGHHEIRELYSWILWEVQHPHTGLGRWASKYWWGRGVSLVAEL